MPTVDYRQFVNRNLPLVERGCTSKSVFVSRAEARSRGRRGTRFDGTLKPYRCRNCGAWHLGHPR